MKKGTVSLDNRNFFAHCSCGTSCHIDRRGRTLKQLIDVLRVDGGWRKTEKYGWVCDVCSKGQKKKKKLNVVFSKPVRKLLRKLAKDKTPVPKHLPFTGCVCGRER